MENRIVIDREIFLSGNIGSAYHAVHMDLKAGGHTYYWLKGGRGSLKSSFTAIEIILGMIADENANCLALRKVSDTLRTSVLATFQWAILKLGLQDFFESTVSPAEITYLPTGQKIILKGLDKPQKLKSIALQKGFFKYVWFEELAEFYGPEEVRNVLQSALRGDTRHVVFQTYNPPDDPASWVNQEAAFAMPGRLIHHSTYLEAPRDWLGEQFIRDAETLMERDFDKYRHEYLGEIVGRTDIAVFGGKWVVQDFTPGDGWNGPYYGADWGFAADPTALVRMWIDDETLYIEYEAYGFRVDIDKTPELFDTVPGSRRYVIRADSARPETISYMSRNGFSIVPAAKWTGCVEDGVSAIRGFKRIMIHPRCRYMQDEARLYSHKIDRLTAQIMPDIVDKHNHLWDAARYGLERVIQSRLTGFTAKQERDMGRMQKTTIAPREGDRAW